MQLFRVREFLVLSLADLLLAPHTNEQPHNLLIRLFETSQTRTQIPNIQLFGLFWDRDSSNTTAIVSWRLQIVKQEVQVSDFHAGSFTFAFLLTVTISTLNSFSNLNHARCWLDSLQPFGVQCFTPKDLSVSSLALSFSR